MPPVTYGMGHKAVSMHARSLIRIINCHVLKQIAQHGNKLKRIHGKYALTLNGLGMDRERMTKYY